MASPTVVGAEGSTSNTDNNNGSSITGVQTGDLCVVVMTATTSQNPTDVQYVSSGTSAGYTQDQTLDGSGTTRVRLWSKVLTSSDHTSGTLHSLQLATFGSGACRIFISVWRHANGWNGSRVAEIDTYTTNGGSSPYTVASLNDVTVPCVGLTFVQFGTGQATLQINWDGAGLADPQWDDVFTGTALSQAGYKRYDTADTPTSVAYSPGATTNKAVITVVYKTVKPPTPIAGKAAAAATAKGTLRNLADYVFVAGKAAAAAHAKGRLYNPRQWDYPAGKASGAATAGGTLRLTRRLAGKAPAAANSRAALRNRTKHPAGRAAGAAHARGTLHSRTKHVAGTTSAAAHARGDLYRLRNWRWTAGRLSSPWTAGRPRRARSTGALSSPWTAGRPRT